MSTKVQVTRLAYGGDGIGTLPDGKTVFVEGAIPGDTVMAEMTQERPRYCKARAVEMLEPSEARIEPRCAYAEACGGCPLQIMGYASQLEWKRRFVVDSLSRIGGIENAEELVGKCVPSKREWGYRNKVELIATEIGGKLQLGYHARGSDEVIPVEECLLLPKKHQKDPRALAGALRYLKAGDYSLERVGIRTSLRTGSTQVNLWTRPGYFPRQAAAKVLGSAVDQSSLVRTLVKGKASARRVSKVEVLDGDEVWREHLAEFDMVASGPSFFQVNTSGAEHLIGLAMEGLDVQAGDSCCDLYCGTGTFTLPMAARSDGVLAVESASSSIHDLRRNLAENGLNAEVIGGDAVRESQGIGQIGKLVMDPPYKGMGPQFSDSVSALSPERIALVSCNPTTLARDMKTLDAIGYRLEKATPVDMFPQTFHVETVAVLSKK